MKALFDFNFQKFVTPSIIKIIYILVMVVLVIGYLAGVITAFQLSAGFGILMLLIIGPILGLFYLALVRAGLESLIAQIRTAENTTELVRLAQHGSGPQAGGYQQPGPGGQTPPMPPTNPYQS